MSMSYEGNCSTFFFREILSLVDVSVATLFLTDQSLARWVFYYRSTIRFTFICSNCISHCHPAGDIGYWYCDVGNSKFKSIEDTTCDVFQDNFSRL
jgi:hypothetical protein